MNILYHTFLHSCGASRKIKLVDRTIGKFRAKIEQGSGGFLVLIKAINVTVIARALDINVTALGCEDEGARHESAESDLILGNWEHGQFVKLEVEIEGVKEALFGSVDDVLATVGQVSDVDVGDVVDVAGVVRIRDSRADTVGRILDSN